MRDMEDAVTSEGRAASFVPPMGRPRAARTAAALGTAAAVVVGGLAIPTLWSAVTGRVPAPAARDAGAMAERAYAQLPLRFEPNRGQSGPGVQFLARGAGYTALISGAESVLRVGGTELPMRVVGADPSAPAETGRRLPGVTNYLQGADPMGWLTGVPGFDRIRFDGVYPGIDLVYRGQGRSLKYDFVVAPGADPGRIALDLGPPSKVEIEPGGDLVVSTPAGDVRHEKPYVYQEVDGKRRTLTGSYIRRAGGDIGFRLGAFDRSRALVIDPVVAYSTLLGGNGSDSGLAVAVDGAGSTFVAAAWMSRSVAFIVF